MTVHEIATVRQQLQERIAAVLSSDEQARYHAYQARLQEAIDERTVAPVEPTADEQAILNKLADDMHVAGLQKQLRVLLRIETLPQ